MGCCVLVCGRIASPQLCCALRTRVSPVSRETDRSSCTASTLSVFTEKGQNYTMYKSFGISLSAKSLVVNKILILFVLMKLFTSKVIHFCWPLTYTAQLRSRQPEFDSRPEVLC